MNIQSRLLSLLLPALTTLVALIALFFYFNWSHEILNNFNNQLQSIVIAASQSINPDEIEWINAHLGDPELNTNPRYQLYRQKLVQLRQQLPIDNLYVVKIEPLQPTDRAKLAPLEQHEEESEEVDTRHKQVFLLDASRPKGNEVNLPGDIDFSETGEQKVYFTKKAFVTPVYESRKTGERFMSAYAPILNGQGQVVALLGADMRTYEIDRKLQNALLAVFLSSLVTLLMVIATVYLIANKISKPVQKLNQAALDIAAGNYEANIQVDGPKEIVELANTFNTMSECLVENISRLRQSSLIRERMYGEYECGLVLQNYMLQKVVEEFTNPHLQMRLTSVNFSNAQKGLMLQCKKDSTTKILSLTLVEAVDRGFQALYNLNRFAAEPLDKLAEYEYPYLYCQFDEDFSSLKYKKNVLHSPLVWSVQSEQFIKDGQNIPLHNQDMIFLYNSGLIEHFKTEEKIQAWFAKILRHFAEDGIDTIHTMLTNDLTFLAKRENLKGNYQIMSLQVKN